MPITLRVFGKTEFVNKYKGLAVSLPSLMTQEMKIQMDRLADYVRISKLSGTPLNRRSGTLSRSINGNATADGTMIRGTVGSKGVPYAAVHELGLKVNIPSHEREISKVFGKPVVPHTITIKAYSVSYPMRAFLKPSLEERRAIILTALRATALEVMRNAT